MAMKTPCQTDGAIYTTHISNNEVLVSVRLGRLLNLTEEQAKILEANLHNALELVLAPYYMEECYARRMSVCRICHKPMYKTDLNQYEECSNCEGEMNFDGRNGQ